MKKQPITLICTRKSALIHNLTISILILSLSLLIVSTITGCSHFNIFNDTSTTAYSDFNSDTSSNTSMNTTAPTESITIYETISPTKNLPISHIAGDFVNVLDYIPNCMIDLRYATNDNFTGCVIYNFTEAYLRYGTILKLMQAEEQFEALGYKIKIWDAFRPFEAQIALWNVYPDGNYVANPKLGYTSHNIGNTVDITLVTLDNKEILMPTAFDDFTAKADRNYADVTVEQAQNAILLEQIMTQCGFRGYTNEWWHYEDTVIYSPDETFLPPANNQ